MSTKNSDYYFLKGGGEMGELIRSKDWSKTSLGDPADWPQSLQTMVAAMLDNPFGMYIAWGSQYIQLYNDACRPILGATKHPEALGISTRETFSEIWDDIIGSMFDDVMKGQAVGYPDLMLPLNRNGFVEECYFDFSYSPIRNNDGEVGGVLVTVIETTDKKKAQAALMENTTQLQFAIDAAELGTWDYNPATDKFTANNRLKTWFGLATSDEIELQHATDAIVEKDRERIILAIKKALDYSSGGNYEEEFSIINPLTKKEIIVQGKGRVWFNDDRIAYRFTGVLQEVTEKVVSRKSIEESEARFRAIADDAPVFIFLAGENAEVEYLNKTWRDYTGISTNDYKGRAWAEITHINDIEPSTKIYMDGFNKRESCSFENRQKGIDGIYRTILWKATPRFAVNGEFIGMMGVGLDIHERKKSEEKLLESEQKVRALVENAPFPIAVYVGKEMIVELANQSIIDIWGKGNDVIGKSFKEVLPELDNQFVFEQIQRVLDTGESFHTKNTPLDLIIENKPYTYYFNYSFTPLYDINGNIYGVMNTGVDLTELNLAKKRIEESDKRFRNTMKQAPVGITILRGPQYVVEMANEAYLELVDKKEAEFVGNPLFKSLPEVEETSHPLLYNVLNTGIPFHGNEVPVPLNRYGTLGEFYFDFIYCPLREEDGTISGVIAVATEVTEQVNARKKIEENAEQIKRFKYMAENANDAFILMREDGTFAYLNERALESWGYTAEQASQLRVPDVDTIYNNEVFNAAFAKAQKEKIPPFETLHKRKDGTIYPVEVNMGGLLLNSIPHMFAVARDITERKKSEEKIRESEQRLRLANEASGVAVWEWNVITGQIKWDNEMFKIYGVTPTVDNLVDYTTWSTAVVPEELAQQENILQTTVKNKGQSSRSFSIRRASDGELRYIEAIETVRSNAAGQAELVVGTNLDVTEKMLAQKKIEENEQRFQAAIQAVQGILWTNNAKGEMEGEQKSWASLTGQTYEEYQGYGWAKVVHPDDAKPTLDAWNDAVQERKTFIFEHRLKVKNGEWRDFSIRAIPLLNADGTLLQWVGVHTDITDNKQAAKTLKANEEKLNIVIEASELGTWEIDLTTNDFSYSNRYLEIMGYPHNKEITVDDTEKRIHPDYIELKEYAIKKSRETGVFYFAGKIIWEDNSIHWIESKAKVFYDAHKTPITIIGTTEDITKERNHQQELEESEKRFRNIADSAPVLIWMADPDNLRYFFNKSWLNFTGRTMEQQTGNGWAERVHPDDLQRCMDIYQSSFDKREPFYMEYRLKRRDGEYRWLSDSGVPRFTSDEAFEGYIGACMDINEQKKAEEQFKALADQAPMWVWLTDTEVNILYANPEVLRFIGIAHYTEFTGIMWEQKVHPEDIGMVYQSFAEAASLQHSFSFDFRVLNAATQQYEWFYIKAVPRLESGECTGFIGTGININEQRLILSQLEYRKALLEAHNESSLDGILLVDTKGKILSYNPRFIEIWNMQQQMVDEKDDEKALAFALTQLVHPEQFMQKVRWMYENPEEISIDELEFKDGKIIERHGYHVAGTDGSYYGCSWMFRDITEQRNYERAVKESEYKFRLLADSMPQHIWTSDTEGNLNYYNQSVLDYSGLTLEQINKDGWIQIVHPDDKEENIKQWVNAVSTGTDFLFEHRFRRHDGEYRWQLSRAIPQRDETGKIQMWVGTSTDIQEQKTFTKELELQVSERTKELETSNIELKKMNKELQSFAYISSHDLQEPLRKIQTFVSRIKVMEENHLSESGRDMFNRMQNAANRMQILIQDLLAYSRTNGTEFSMEKTDLSQIIAEIKEDLEEEIQEKHATIETDALCAVDIIPFQFRQLMVNLVSNALKFSKTDNPPIIKIKSEIGYGSKMQNPNLEAQKRYCHITVSDNGIGFEQHYAEKIFEVFQRLHGKNEYNGTGIGLSIVKKIVENHNGVIIATGELNTGATFDIYIPAT